MNLDKISRRGWLSAAIGTAVGFVTSRASAAIPTPRQTTGPFYPHNPAESDANLTQLRGHSEPALGEVIEVRGRVLDEEERAIADAVIEVWQANTHGRYSHERDANNPRPLDPNFQGFAELLTNDRGEYSFKTVKPGSYPAGSNWMRPPHIHFKVARRGYHEVATQMYFAGDPLNEKDGIRNSLSPAERDSVTVRFARSGRDPAVSAGAFDITLRRVT